MTIHHQLVSQLLALLLLFSTFAAPETINIASNPAFPKDLFSSMRSTFDVAQKQKSQLGSLFSTDGFFAGLTSSKPTTNGNNMIEGSGNQLQGYNNKVSG